ncbi:NADP-dependent alcohol dehydrogenase [Marssonina coronariae]|uniref:NADP-dependent alcohol dehydrogenase n=1 Tax=Diplocarpon coronariae TaxID=2795749 RepID=A0A218Z6J7_9HELO|nr:NADP-dependent alcohol dehydrogenase [Marssonina coronariae]
MARPWDHLPREGTHLMCAHTRTGRLTASPATKPGFKPKDCKGSTGTDQLTRRPTNRVFHIPDGLPTSKAAPLLCAGLTGCSSLGRNSAGARKRPDITGMSGIGHLGHLSSKALCAGTDWDRGWDRGWDREHIMKSDLIVCMASSTEGMDPGAYLQSLDVHGRFVGVASPEGSGQVVKTQDFFRSGSF